VFPIGVEIGLKESYLSAIDYLDRKLKTFKFSRISNLLIDETLVKPVEMEIFTESQTLNPHKAQLLVKPDGLQFIEDDKSVLKILSETDDGTLIEIDYWNQDWLIRRVRSFAPNVLIIEPEGLKAEFLKRVEGVLARYNS
jgi:predicted DNA-binding transcriptional regulator YafY